MKHHHFYVIEYDTDPANPRKEFSNLGTMYHHPRDWHKGDEPIPDDDETGLKASLLGWEDQKVERLWDFWSNRLGAHLPWRKDSYPHPEEVEFYRRVREKVEGRVATAFEEQFVTVEYPYGFMAVSKEVVRKEYGWTQLTRQRLAHVTKVLEGEAATFQEYLDGEVYGFRVFSITPEFEERYREDLEDLTLQEFVDEIQDSGWLAREEYDKQIAETYACGGFYGKRDCEEEAKSIVKYQDEHWQEYQDRLSGQQQLPLAA